MWALYLFNILLNGILDFLCAYFMLTLLLAFWKIKNSKLLLALLYLPVLKLIIFLCLGVPQSSILYAQNIAILSFPFPAGSSVLQAGLALNWLGPFLYVDFATHLQPSGLTQYGMSLPDIISLWFNHQTHGIGVALVVCFLVCVSVFLVVREIMAYYRFESARLKSRKSSGQMLAAKEYLGMKIDIYLSSANKGTPFTGGFFHPYICIPTDIYERSNASEREAILAHELAHIKHFDLWINSAITFVGCIFWFIPFYNHLLLRIAKLRELLADEHAQKCGANPVALASALLKLEENIEGIASNLQVSFAKTQSIIAIRIERLLKPHEHVHSNFIFKTGQFILILFFYILILSSNIFSNSHFIR